MSSTPGRRSRQLLKPLPLHIDSDYGKVRALAWWLSGGEIRFSCKRRILPGTPRTIYVRVPGEDPIPLEVMVRKASTMPAEGDVDTFLHKGSYRLLRASDEPRLRRVRQQGDPENPVRAPTITGSVTPKKRKRSKTFPSSKALREAMARGRGGTEGRDWWAPDGVPAVFEPGDLSSLYLDLSVEDHLQRCVDRRTEHVRLHVSRLDPEQEGMHLAVTVQLPDRTFEQLEAVVERIHGRGTVLLIESETRIGLAPGAPQESTHA